MPTHSPGKSSLFSNKVTPRTSAEMSGFIERPAEDSIDGLSSLVHSPRRLRNEYPRENNRQEIAIKGNSLSGQVSPNQNGGFVCYQAPRLNYVEIRSTSATNKGQKGVPVIEGMLGFKGAIQFPGSVKNVKPKMPRRNRVPKAMQSEMLKDQPVKKLLAKDMKR